jgi:hypothetical protein
MGLDTPAQLCFALSHGKELLRDEEQQENAPPAPKAPPAPPAFFCQLVESLGSRGQCCNKKANTEQPGHGWGYDG